MEIKSINLRLTEIFKTEKKTKEEELIYFPANNIQIRKSNIILCPYRSHYAQNYIAAAYYA